MHSDLQPSVSVRHQLAHPPLFFFGRAAQTRDLLRAALMLEEKGSTDEQSKAKGLRAARTLADAVLDGSKGL